MILQPDAYLHDSMIHRVDPRIRVVAALVFSVVVVLGSRSPATGLLVALVTAAFAEIRIGALALRLVPLNLLMLVLIATLPFSIPGRAMFLLGPWTYSFEGFGHALNVACKGNAIVIMLTALIATIEPVRLGYSLEWFRVPQKLTRLFLFTVRYFSVIESEFNRLSRAMMMRGFRPGLNLHTLRSYGYLAGMLLVHALDRSERILDAMRCRGFDGHFRSIEVETSRVSRWDFMFVVALGTWTVLLLNLDHGWW